MGLRLRGWLVTVIGAMALGLVPPVEAQPAAAGQFVRFTVFAAKPLRDVAFQPRANAGSQKLVFHPTARSPRYEYQGAMPLRFVDAETRVVVAEAAIPAGMRDAFLLFSPIEAASGTKNLRYQIAVLDDGPTRQPAGTVAFLNLSGLALSGVVNSEKVTLKAGLNPPLSVGKTAKVTLATAFKNRTYQSYAATLALGRNERALVVLFPPFNAGSLEVQSRVLQDQPGGTGPAMAGKK